MICTPRGPHAAVAALTGALTFSVPDSVLLTVRQGDRQATASDLAAASVSTDGRYVAFASFARLVAADTNSHSDIYVLDRVSGTVTLESLSPDGRALAYDNIWPRINGDGRFVVFETLREHPAGVIGVIALRDRWRGTTRFLQRGAEPPNRNSREPVISSDGRVVVFSSNASNLCEDTDINGAAEDVYTFDTATGRFDRVNVATEGRQPSSGASFSPMVSADGRYVAFTSTADLDSPPDPQERPPASVPNVYWRDTEAHVTRRISTGRDGGAANGASYTPAIAGDGGQIAFVSEATNLVSGDDNRFADVFLYDAHSRTTVLVSRGASGASANGPSRKPAIASNGNSIVFQSDASDLTCARRCPSDSKDINLVSDVFLFDRVTRTIRRISTGRQPWMEPSAAPSISGTAAVVAFSSRHPVDETDTGNDFDLFVWMNETPSLTYLLKRP